MKTDHRVRLLNKEGSEKWVRKRDHATQRMPFNHFPGTETHFWRKSGWNRRGLTSVCKNIICFKGLVAKYSITLWTLRLHQLNKINLGSGDRASSKFTGNSHRKSDSVQKTERCPGNSREVLWVWQFFVCLFSLVWWKDALFWDVDKGEKSASCSSISLS